MTSFGWSWALPSAAGLWSSCFGCRATPAAIAAGSISVLPACRSRWSAFITPGDKTSRLNQAAGCRFQHRFGAGRGAELAAGIVDVEIDGPLGQVSDFGELRRGIAARRPGQNFNLALVECDRLRPQPGAGDAGEPRGD